MNKQQRAFIVWAVVSVLVVAWLITASIVSASGDSSYKHKLGQYNEQRHFYMVIAGQQQPGTGVADTLAVDLKQTQESRLRFFLGNSNSYGGITDAIGFDPFDNSCGVECGPLTSTASQQIIRAKHGEINVAKPHKHSANVILPLLLLALWQLAASSYLLLPAVRRLRSMQALEHTYPDEWHTIRELDKALQALPDHATSDASELLRLRNSLQGALLLRMSSNDIVTGQRVDRLKEEAREKLAAVEAGNKALES